MQGLFSLQQCVKEVALDWGFNISWKVGLVLGCSLDSTELVVVRRSLDKLLNSNDLQHLVLKSDSSSKFSSESVCLVQFVMH